MVYTITFNPALDYIMKVEALSYDDISRSNDEAISYGGKGINVSVVLSRLGIDNKAFGFIAGFTGKELEARLKKDNIDCNFIRLKSGMTRINVKIKSEGELDINAKGPDIDEDDIRKLLTKLDEIESGDFLVLAGSVPENLPSDIYERILKRLSERGINFVVDATGDLLLNTLKYKPFLIKPNHHELGDLFKTKAENDEEIERYARELQKLGAKNVLISRSENGALLLDENGAVYKIKNAPGKLINSVGCGDSMVAGFIAGYINTKDYSKALKLGTACGNATAYSETLATEQKIMKTLNELK